MEISPETSSKDGEKITKSVENVDKDGPDTSSEPETKANFNHYAVSNTDITDSSMLMISIESLWIFYAI